MFHGDATATARLACALSERNFTVSTLPDGASSIAAVYNDPPDLIIIHLDVPPKGGLAIAREIKLDNVFAHIPVLLLAPPDQMASLLAGGDFPFDDYLVDTADPTDLMARVDLIILRTKRQLDANPLTRLPGNNSITHELETRLRQKQDFATVYIDLDNFKAFNDKYGFDRGDQALRLTARLLVNCVSAASPQDYFIGHVGGDDFLFITPQTQFEEACDLVIQNFDAITRSLYDDDDRQKGFIVSKNRHGEEETFALMTISLAVVLNHNGRYSHHGEISAVSAELKKQAKKQSSSCCVVDRRHSPASERDNENL